MIKGIVSDQFLEILKCYKMFTSSTSLPVSGVWSLTQESDQPLKYFRYISKLVLEFGTQKYIAKIQFKAVFATPKWPDDVSAVTAESDSIGHSPQVTKLQEQVTSLRPELYSVTWWENTGLWLADVRANAAFWLVLTSAHCVQLARDPREGNTPAIIVKLKIQREPWDFRDGPKSKQL